jgi:hypothetical protein
MGFSRQSSPLSYHKAERSSCHRAFYPFQILPGIDLVPPVSGKIDTVHFHLPVDDEIPDGGLIKAIRLISIGKQGGFPP